MWKWWLVPMLLVAGCAGPEEQDPVTDDPTEAPRVVVAGKGTIDLKVVVVDETIVPVANASISLPAANLTAVTGQGGTVVFEGLEIGTYLVRARAVGFLETTSVFDVSQHATVKVLLMRDPEYVEPRIDTLFLQGFVSGRETGFSRGSNTDLFYDDCDCVINRPAPPALRGFVVDVLWDDNIAKPVGEPRKFRWLMTTDETFDWEVRRGPSPWTEHVDPTIFSSHNSTEWWEIMFYPDDDWIKFEQPFEAYWSAFIAREVPDGWTIIPPE